MATIEELESLRWDLRRDCVDIIMAGAGGHIGGDMSVIDALMTLYANHLNISPETVDDPNRDRFVLSKGHAMEAYYAVLCHEGYLDLDDVKARFSKFGSPYIGHPNNKLKGIEMNSGSLGHGLPVAVGMALAGKMDGRDYRVYTIMGDGELAEGSVWEGAMSGGNYQLDNLRARGPQPPADQRQHRGRYEAGQPGGALGCLWVERAVHSGQRRPGHRRCADACCRDQG